MTNDPRQQFFENNRQSILRLLERNTLPVTIQNIETETVSNSSESIYSVDSISNTPNSSFVLVPIIRNNRSTQSEIDKIPQFTYQNTIDCPICHSVINNGDKLALLKCEHYFHHACLTKWLLRYNSNCPYCRKRV